MSALETKMSDSHQESPKSLKPAKVEKQPAKPLSTDLQDSLLGIAATVPTTRHWLAALKPEMIIGEEAQQLLSYLQQNPQEIIDPPPEGLQNIEQYVKIVQLKSDTRYANWEEQQFQAEMARVVKQLITKHRETKKQQLIEQLRDAETIGDEAKAKSLRQAINALIKERV
jgi:hypothetical protein